mmetsp:Transcript_397/g.999  ORF Transcript_397/g.999 Transcript_397/m.999 type:complete len:170 (+) Transcript_397:352-861(+)
MTIALTSVFPNWPHTNTRKRAFWIFHLPGFGLLFYLLARKNDAETHGETKLMIAERGSNIRIHKHQGTHIIKPNDHLTATHRRQAPISLSCPATVAVTSNPSPSRFLGSGKSTLLNHILSSQSHGQKFAVIENELGKVSIDDQVIRIMSMKKSSRSRMAVSAARFAGIS